MTLSNDTLFNYLPKNFKVDEYDTNEDAIYTLAHDIVITSTETAIALTGLELEDFDEEREEAIDYVIKQIKLDNMDIDREEVEYLLDFVNNEIELIDSVDEVIKKYGIVVWPESQDYIGRDDCYLINDEKGFDMFGSSAYIIPLI